MSYTISPEFLKGNEYSELQSVFPSLTLKDYNEIWGAKKEKDSFDKLVSAGVISYAAGDGFAEGGYRINPDKAIEAMKSGTFTTAELIAMGIPAAVVIEGSREINPFEGVTGRARVAGGPKVDGEIIGPSTTLYGGRSKFHEGMREFLSSGGVSTALRNTDELQAEFDDLRSTQHLFDAQARSQAIAQATVDAAKVYDEAASQGGDLGITRQQFITDYKGEVERSIDGSKVSPYITLHDEGGNVVFIGDRDSYVDWRLASESSTKELGIEYAKSSAPVYGTIRYGREAAKDGWTPKEVGLMAASIGADVAMIVPPIGMAARSAVNPALVGLRGASRGAIIGRNVRTALSAFRVRPTFVRPTLSGAWRGVKTVAGEYWKGLKYGVGHPVATARGAGGLLTGSRVFYPVPVGFKGTANQYVQQQLEASMRVPGNIQPPTSGARYKQGTPLGTVTYESGGVGTELAGGTSRPAGVIRETVMPGTQGMQIGAETRLKSGVSQVGNQYLMAATPDEALSGTTVRSGFTRFGDKFFRVVPESEAFVTRTVVQWQPGVKSGTITERVVLSPEQMSIQHANAPKTGFDVNKLWEMQSSIGQSPASTGGRRMSPAQLELLERLHMQPSSLNHPSWMKIEPVQDLSFGGGGVSTLSPTGTKVVTGGGVMTAPSTATMTPAQLQKLLGTSPITIAAGIPIGAGAIGSPVLRPYIGTDQGVSPYTLPYPGASPYTTSIPGLRPVVRPYVAPSPSTFPSTSTSPSPTTDPYPATVPVPVPVVPGTSLVPDGDTPPPPKPGVPPLLPLSLPSLSASSSPIIGGGYNKPSPLGMWVFGYNVSGVHPLTGKMVRAKGKKSMRYGAVESRILKSRNLGNNQGGSSGKIYKAVTRV